jgi:hypothetical protein
MFTQLFLVSIQILKKALVRKRGYETTFVAPREGDNIGTAYDLFDGKEID